MPDIEEQFKKIADEYSSLENDQEKSHYELTVNWPSVLALIPVPPAKVLDYGCGSGLYTGKLIQAGYDAFGTDNSLEMLSHAQDLESRLRVWSYQDTLLEEKFDVIIAKLVVQFIMDLPTFAAVVNQLIVPGGCVVISVPSPEKSRLLAEPEKGKNVYLTPIGESGLKVDMIHRETGEYEAIFSAAGFKLIQTVEPIDPERPDQPSKRLNMLFVAT